MMARVYAAQVRVHRHPVLPGLTSSLFPRELAMVNF